MAHSPLTAIVQRYKALAHPARLRIAAMLRSGELCVCQMTAVLALAPSTVSAHLAELRRGGCVRERKEGRWVFYVLTREGEQLLVPVLAELAADGQLARDTALIEQLRAVGPEKLCRVDLDLRKLGIGRSATRAR
jgi:ArsR family transcriptional regulator